MKKLIELYIKQVHQQTCLEKNMYQFFYNFMLYLRYKKIIDYQFKKIIDYQFNSKNNIKYDFFLFDFYPESVFCYDIKIL